MSNLDRNAIPLPPNAEILERAYIESGTRILDQTIPIDTVWDAWRCPAPLLPWLAYALSVDFWDDAWDEVTKRRAIADAPELHRRKGTRWAVERAAGMTGRTFSISEWWQEWPEARRGTFRVSIDLAEGEATLPASEGAKLRRFITSAKPKSRAFTLTGIRATARSVAVYVGTASRYVSMRTAIRPAIALSLRPVAGTVHPSMRTIREAF